MKESTEFTISAIAFSLTIAFVFFQLAQCQMHANEQMKEVYLGTGEYPAYQHEGANMLPPPRSEQE